MGWPRSALALLWLGSYTPARCGEPFIAQHIEPLASGERLEKYVPPFTSDIMRSHPAKKLTIHLLIVLSVCQVGCVTRRLTVRSNPPGALVYIDNYEIGTTPCSTSYTNYGTRQIRLVKDGYETLTVNQPIPAPWYEWPGIDFVSENLVPRDIRDERALTFNMQPQMVVPNDILLTRAEELRRDAKSPAGMAAANVTTAPILGPSRGPLLIPPAVMPGPPPAVVPEALPPPMFAPPAR